MNWTTKRALRKQVESLERSLQSERGEVKYLRQLCAENEVHVPGYVERINKIFFEAWSKRKPMSDIFNVYDKGEDVT